MRHLRAAGILFALFFASVMGCRQPATSANIAVSIDGEEIHYNQFESYLREHVDSSDLGLDSDVLSRLFDQFLDAQLLIRLAIERGLVDRDPYVQQAAGTPAAPSDEGEPGTGDPDRPSGSGVDQRRAIAFLLRGGLRQSWSAQEVAAYYAAHQDEFQRPDQVHLRQILAHERERAESAQEALARGEDFAQVAARFSQGPKAHLGGDQGRLGREDLPPAFIDTVFALEPGETSAIVAADYGFLIFQVVARYDAIVTPLEDVVGEIHQALQRRHIDDLIAGFIAEARERYNVKVFPDNFPFGYRGSYST